MTITIPTQRLILAIGRYRVWRDGIEGAECPSPFLDAMVRRLAS